MDADSADHLLKIMLQGDNDAWRDDAAEHLARLPDRAEAERALLSAIGDDRLDDSRRRTCA
jgi:hypothetical protein